MLSNSSRIHWYYEKIPNSLIIGANSFDTQTDMSIWWTSTETKTSSLKKDLDIIQLESSPVWDLFLKKKPILFITEKYF